MISDPSSVSDHARLTALYEASAATGVSLNLEEALVTVMDAALRLAGAERGFIVLRGANTDQLEFCVTRNDRGETVTGNVFDAGVAIAKEAYEAGEPVLVDPSTPPPPGLPPQQGGPGLAIPLKTGGDIVGVMYLDGRAGAAPFTAEDVDVLQAFASQAAVAVVNARLFEAQKQEVEVNRALLAIARLSQNVSSVDELMQAVGRTIPALVDCDRCSLFLWDEAAGGFRPAYFSYEEDPDFVAALGVVRPEAVPLADEVRRLPAPLVVSPGDWEGKLPPEWMAHAGIQPFVISPIRSGHQFIGVLVLDNHVSRRPFLSHTLVAAEAASHQLAISIQRLNLFESVQRHVDELTLLHTIAAAGAQAADEDALIETVTRLIGTAFYPDNFGVILVDEAAGTLHEHPSYQDRSGVKHLALSIGSGITGQVAATGQPRRVADVRLDPDYVAGDSRTQSELCVPLKVGGRVIGVINAESARLAAFQEADERLLMTIAGQMATAIEKLRSLKAHERRAAELDAVRRMSLALTSSLSLPDVLNTLLESVLRLVPDVEDAHIFLYDGSRLSFGAALWADGRRGDPFSEPRPEGLTAAVARGGQMIVVPDMRAHPLFVGAPETWQGAILGLPLKIGERVVGVMNVAYTRPRIFEESEIRLLSLLGDQAAGAIENARLFEATQRQLNELTVLHAVATAGNEAEDEDDLVQRVTQIIGATLYPDNFGVLFVDEAAKVLRSHPSYHVAPQEQTLTDTPIPLGRGITGHVAVTGRPWRVPDASREPAYLAVDPLTRSELCVPLKVGGRVIGVVNTESRRPEAFTVMDERLLITVAGQLATAIEKLRLFGAERAARAQAETLREVASSLHVGLDREGVLQRILEQLARVVPYDSASVMLLSNQHLQIVARRGFRSERQNLTPVEMEGLQHLQELIRSRRPLIIPDVQNDPRWKALPDGGYIRCWLGVPMIAQDQVIGLLNLDKEQPGFYTERDAALAVAFANQAALTLQNARLLEAERRQLRLAQTLQAVGALLTSQMSLQEVFESLFDLLAQVIAYDSVSMQMLDEEGYMYLAAGRGFPDPEQARQNVRVVSQQRPPGTWLRHTVMLIPDTHADERWIRVSGGEYIRSWIGAALVVRGRLLGTLTADSRTPMAYGAEEAETLTAFANQAAVAIENAQLYAETQRRLTEQTLLYECSQALTLAPDAQAAIVAVTEHMLRYLDATSISYFAYDESGGAVRVDYEHWTPQASAGERQSALGQTWKVADYPHMTGVLRTRLPSVIRRDDPALTPLEHYDFIRWEGQVAVLVPMAVHDRVLGYFEIWDSRSGHAYREAGLRLLSALANQAAVVVERLRLLDETRRRETELELLLEVARAVSSSLEFDKVMQQVAASTAKALRMEACAISSYEPELQRVRTLAVHSLPGATPLAMNLTFRLTDYPATVHVLETGEPMVAQMADPAADPAETELLRQLGYATLLMFPLRAAQRVLGLVELYTRDGRRAFTADEIHLARTLADQAGVAIENARLFQAEREQRELAEALRQVGAALSATLDFNTILDRLLEHVARVVPYDTACMMMVEGRRARVARARGYDRFGPLAAQAIQGLSFNISTTANLRRMSETGLPLVISETGGYPGWEVMDASAHIRSWAGAPVAVQGEIIAFFSLDKADPNFYRPEHAERLAAFASQAALALQNARLFEAEHRRVAMLTALHETALDLSAQLDLYTLLQTIVERAVRLMEAAMGALYLFRPDGQALELRVGHNLPQDYAGVELKLGEGVAGRAAQLDKPLIVGTYSNWPGRIPTLESANWESVIGVPIKWRERVLGVIVVADEKAHRYLPSDAEMVGLFADKAAVAIVNARLFEETRRQTRELMGLYGTALATSSVLDTKTLLSGLYQQVDDLMAPDAFGVALYDADADQIEFVLAMERERALPQILGLRFPLAEAGLTGWVVRTRQPVLFGDLKRDSLPVPPRHITSPARAWLGAPLIARDRVIGAVTAQSFRPQAFDESDLRFLESAARQVAVALENARLFEALVDEKGRLELLYTLSQHLTATLDPREVAARALDLIRTHLGAYKAELFLLEAGSDLLHLIAAPGLETESIEALDRQLDLRLGRGLAGRTALTRTPAIAPDVTQNPHWINVPGLDDGVRSAASVPLLVGEELVGVFNLMSDREGFFHEDHLRVLRAVAAPVALALQNARLYQAEARRAHHLALLNKITRTALESQNLPGMLDMLAEQMGQFLAADACYIALWDEARQMVTPMAAYGRFHESYATLPPQPGPGTITESVMRAGRALAADDAEDSPYVNADLTRRFGHRSALGLPLIAGDQKLGAVIVAFDQPHHFTPDEIARGEQAARQIALALAKARLLEEARRHADEMMAASDILRALNAAPDVLQAFSAMVAGLRAITACTRISLALLDESRDWFTIVAADPSEALSPGTRVRVTETSTSGDALAGRPHLTADLSGEAELPYEQALYQAGYRSRINLPLHAGERVIGLLNLVWSQPSGYNPAHLPLLGQMADAVALAVEKKRLFDETRRRADELETLSQLSAVMRLAESTSDILQTVLHRSIEVFHADSGAVAAPGPEPDMLVVTHEEGWPISIRDAIMHLDDSIFGHVFHTGQPYLAPDIGSDPLAHRAVTTALLEKDSRARTAIYAPIRTREAVIGIIAISALAPRNFTEADLGLLTAIAEITGNALRRAGVMETLEQRVSERTRELAEANERLKELDRLKDQFVSNVSHELRTPITNLKLHLGLLEKRGPELLDRYLPILQRETERLRRLIEDLLNLSRLQAQAFPPQREPHLLDPLLAEVIAVHTMRAETKQIALRHEANPNPLEVPMDRAQLLQVFTNLIGNAVAYTPEGGHVTVSTTLAQDGPKAGVAVRVHNNLPVVPPDELPHLFERFYRGSAASESGEPGTGLGLSICREIVERHGGHIEAQSREAEGTAFTVWLPLAPGAES
jgi:GAF domain-containing protein